MFSAEKAKRLLPGIVGLVVIVAAGTLGAVGHAEADLIYVDQVTDVAGKASNHGGESRTYETDALTYGGTSCAKKLVLFMYRGGQVGRLVGGLENNVSNPRIAPDKGTGFVNRDDAVWWGLDVGQVLADVDGGFWAGVDLNGDGDIGTYNTSTGEIVLDVDEYFGPEMVEFSGFDPFPESGTATIASINIIPEPATLSLLALGATGLAIRRRRHER